ncbi:hypothetical protein BGP_6303 [Beggiatoa sp. PS]|nr:hypothetical protein BGP_6303 [Beggiatoa sp. PS]
MFHSGFFWFQRTGVFLVPTLQRWNPYVTASLFK